MPDTLNGLLCQVNNHLNTQFSAYRTHHFVNLVRCDTRAHRSMSFIQDLPGKQACFADACYLLWGVDWHCVQQILASVLSRTLWSVNQHHMYRIRAQLTPSRISPLF